MNAQQLRNSILQEAIEGRLVPQDPNDEPASALLERIREEKRRLVKEGKLKKKDLVETPISEDEKPFEIPESWEWTCLGNVLSKLTDGSHNPPPNSGFGYPVISALNIRNGEITLDNVQRYVTEQDFLKENPRTNISRGDIILGIIGGSIGNIAIYNHDTKVIAQRSIAIMNPLLINHQFTLYILKSPFVVTQLSKYASGSAQGGVYLGNLKQILLPLPPLAEQKRIVAKIEELMPKVEEYGKAQEALDKLNAELPEKLKKSILQEAIEGRLVPQDPNDEPASVLLDKIRKEKAQLVKEGKLKKKDLVETPISEDEIPFEIPESWEWCRVSTILNILDAQRKPVTKSDRETGIYPYCGANGILDYVKDYIFDGRFILVGEDGSVATKYGNPVVNKIEGKIWVNNHAHILQEFGGLGYQNYIYYALLNTDISIFIHGFMPKYSQGDLRKTLIPLPPLAEQHRIVERIEKLMGGIEML